jgi:hypothetical protein
VDVLAKILADESISKNMAWTPRDSGENCFGHFSTGTFMKETSILIPQGKKALHFGFSSDSTTIVRWGTRSFHPIYIWLPQYEKDDKNPAKTVECVGLIPKLKMKGVSQERLAHYRVTIWHRCYEHLLAPIRQIQKGIKWNSPKQIT